MTRNVGERWEEYLRLGRRMSPHTVAAYLGDFHSLIEFLSLRADATPEQLREALTQRAVRSWLAQTLAQGGARSTIARHTAAIRNFTAWATREGILASDPAALLSSPRADQRLPSPMNPMRGRFSMLRGTRLRREEPPRFAIGRSSNLRTPAGFASPKSAHSTSHL